MANILIVHAHPEPKSFSSALAGAAAASLAAEGHAVTITDLYALGFDPVSSRRNFTTVADPGYFKPQAEERHATQVGGFAPELEVEMRKLEACDVLIFSFPLWWFGLPAMLKGWVDRVFAMGRTYGSGRLYENGIGRGKRAMVLMTTGSPATAFRQHGVHASLESILAPIHHGVFWFNGYVPLRPFVTWRAAHITDAGRAAELRRLEGRMKTLLEEPAPRLVPLAECGAESWADEVPRFLVVVSGTADPVGAPPIPAADLQQLARLRLEGTLLRALLPAQGARTWQAALELRARTAPEAEARVRALAFARHGSLACTLLDSIAANDLSPSWVEA